MEHKDMEDGQFTHRVVDAATAPRLQTSGVNSAFAILGTQPAAAEKRTSPNVERLLKTLEACGPLTVEQVARALELTLRQATDLVSVNVRKGRLVKREKAGRGYSYGLADSTGAATTAAAATKPSGFKQWLEKTATKEAGAALPPPAHSGRRSPPARPLTVGIFSNGLVRVELGRDALTMERADALVLCAYLTRMRGLLEE